MIVEYQQMDQMENLQLLIQEVKELKFEDRACPSTTSLPRSQHLHVSAFGATSRLGRPHLCPIPQIPKVTNRCSWLKQSVTKRSFSFPFIPTTSTTVSSSLCHVPPVQITKSALEEYMGAYYNAPRMVLSGAGVNHQELVELADKYFAHMPTKPTSSLLEPVESVESP